MGTTFSVKIVKNNFLLLGDSAKKIHELDAGINAVLEKVNRQMSTYRKDSEISRFNSYKKTDWFKVSLDTANVVLASIKVSEKSGGKFDITIGHLVNLWGFGKDFFSGKIPSLNEIKNLRKRVGYHNLEVKLNPPELRKKIPELYCDLSAIAKGYGVDKVAQYLNESGFYNWLVEVGGEIRVRGRNGNGELWHLGIQSPGNESKITRVVSISDSSMATSGDYHNYFEKNGVRYSHTIDPSTGYPIRHKLVSVTVMGKNCMMADALATAIDVMGPEIGYKFAVKEGLAVLLIKKDISGFIEKMTPDFRRLLKK